jgi:hypothetical protein
MKPRAIVFAMCALFAGSARVEAQELGQVIDRLMIFWTKGDATAISSLVARTGISLDVDGGPIGPLSARQTAAVLRRVFDDRETVALHASLTQIVGGAPARAFGELTWFVRARGTTIPEHATVFVALVLERDGWRVTQIRLLR